MTSFAVTIEPAAGPRTAAGIALLHVAAAASPWLARCPPAIAAAASLLALAGFAASIATVPGPHHRLRAVALDAGRCRAWLTGGSGWVAAELTKSTRVAGGWVLLELRVEGRRRGWLLSGSNLPADAFRRLKALIRLA